MWMHGNKRDRPRGWLVDFLDVLNLARWLSKSIRLLLACFMSCFLSTRGIFLRMIQSIVCFKDTHMKCFRPVEVPVSSMLASSGMLILQHEVSPLSQGLSRSTSCATARCCCRCCSTPLPWWCAEYSRPFSRDGEWELLHAAAPLG